MLRHVSFRLTSLALQLGKFFFFTAVWYALLFPCRWAASCLAHELLSVCIERDTPLIGAVVEETAHGTSADTKKNT